MSVEQVIRELTSEIITIQDLIDDLTPFRDKKVIELNEGLRLYLSKFQDLITFDIPQEDLSQGQTNGIWHGGRFEEIKDPELRSMLQPPVQCRACGSTTLSKPYKVTQGKEDDE